MNSKLKSMNRGHARRFGSSSVGSSHCARKSIHSVFIEGVLFLCIFGLIAHLSVNFWERYVIHHEITKLKSSLYSLQDTLNYIGTAYDNLHKEMTVLAQITDEKLKPIGEINNDNQGFHAIPINDFQVQAFVDRTDKKVSPITVVDTQTQHNVQPVCGVIKLIDLYKSSSSSIGTSPSEYICKINKDASTAASFPTSAIGVGSNTATCQSNENRNRYKNRKIYSKPEYDDQNPNNMYVSLSVPF